MKKLTVLNSKRVLLVLLSLSLMTAFYSCKKAAEKASEKMIEKSIGDDAEVNINDDMITVKTDEGTFTTDAKAKDWPQEIPKDVPEFTNGKVTAVTTQVMGDSQNWVIVFEDVAENAIEDYKTTLTDKGFTIVLTTTAGTGGYMTAEKDDYNVVVMAAEGDATVTVGVKK